MNTELYKTLKDTADNITTNYAVTLKIHNKTIINRKARITYGIKKRQIFIVANTIDRFHPVKCIYFGGILTVEWITPENIKKKISKPIYGTTDIEKMRYAEYLITDTIKSLGAPYLGFVRYPAQNPDYKNQ